MHNIVKTTNGNVTEDLEFILFENTDIQEPEVSQRTGFIYFYLKKIFFAILGPHPQHMEAPRLGVESELQLPAYITVTATGSEPHLRPTPQLTAAPDP